MHSLVSGSAMPPMVHVVPPSSEMIKCDVYLYAQNEQASEGQFRDLKCGNALRLNWGVILYPNPSTEFVRPRTEESTSPWPIGIKGTAGCNAAATTADTPRRCSAWSQGATRRPLLSWMPAPGPVAYQLQSSALTVFVMFRGVSHELEQSAPSNERITQTSRVP